MASFPQLCGQNAYRDGTSAVAALSRQGLDAQGTGAILHSAGAVVTPAVAQCLGAWRHDMQEAARAPLPASAQYLFEALGLYREEAYGEHGGH
jgi:hypothetical protein